MGIRLQAVIVVPCAIGVLATAFGVLGVFIGNALGMPPRLCMPPVIRGLGILLLALGFLFMGWLYRYRKPMDILVSTYLTMRKTIGRIRQDDLSARTEPLILLGPQRYVRHPMYFAVVVLWLGWWLVLDYTFLLFMAAFFFLWFNAAVIPFEEKELRALYGEQYEAYAKAVPRFLPSLKCRVKDGAKSLFFVSLFLVLPLPICVFEEDQDRSTPQQLPGGAPLDGLAEKLLGVSPEQLAQWWEGEQAGLIEVKAVHLPYEPPGDCDHYGWPIATAVDATLIVMHRRIPGHNPYGAGEPNSSMSYGVVLRSADDGKTWSAPYDLRASMRPEDRDRGGIVPLSARRKFDKNNTSQQGYKIHMHALGTTHDGAVVAVNNHGVFRSDDQGKTWQHFADALRDDTFPDPIVNVGPGVIDSPEHGLLVFGNWSGNSVGFLKAQDLVVLQSKDGGAHWNACAYDVGFPQYEPAALARESQFLFVARDLTEIRTYRQMTWEMGTPPKVIPTNLENPQLVDTVDLSYNPATERFELVCSERHHMELWLWSMKPSDWESGKWTRECRLLARGGVFYQDADGFHPAGAVVDATRGVQHIFIYSGHPNGPAGVFRITRTLDTPALVAFLKGGSRPGNL